MFGEIKDKMVKLFGISEGSEAATSDNLWRALTVTSEGRLITTDKSTFFPYAGSNQSVVVSNVSNASAGVFTALSEYIFWSTVACHVRFGVAGVTAIASDPHIPANVLFPFIPTYGETKIAVLKTTLITPTPSDGLLFVFRSAR